MQINGLQKGQRKFRKYFHKVERQEYSYKREEPHPSRK